MGLEALSSFVAEHGNALVPISYKMLDGFPLGEWVRERRVRRNFLSEERKAKLEAFIGWRWIASANNV
jgi:hypothetical protein